MAPQQSGAKDKGGFSSFPGIWKYPTGRDEKFVNAMDWIEAKKVDDDIGNHWRVYDKLYDLEKFIDLHPGGSEWIELTRGTDITEAFETHHIVNVDKVEATLAKYYVKDTKVPRISPYTFKDNGFFKTLKRRAEPILKAVGTGPTKQIEMWNDGLVLTAFLLVTIGTLTQSTIIQILGGLILTSSVVASHNFFHLRQNWRTYYWDLSLLSSREWRVSHSLSHHLYPNTIMDAEISMFEPLFEFLPNRPKSLFQRYAPVIYQHAVFGFMFHLSFWVRWKKIIMGQQKLRPENLINVAELLYICLLSPSLLYGVRTWLVVHTASSWFFLLIGLNVAHHHPDIFHDGDEARPDPDFGLCQLDAVRDKTLDMDNLFVILITFGNHSLHHLFPAVCHSKLHHLKKIFDQTLEEFSESFPPMSFPELYLGNLRRCALTTTKKLKGN